MEALQYAQRRDAQPSLRDSFVMRGVPGVETTGLLSVVPPGLKITAFNTALHYCL